MSRNRRRPEPEKQTKPPCGTRRAPPLRAAHVAAKLGSQRGGQVRMCTDRYGPDHAREQEPWTTTDAPTLPLPRLSLVRSCSQSSDAN